MTAGPEPREHAPQPRIPKTRSGRRPSSACARSPGRRPGCAPDQWTAIKALVVDRRRALVVQRTGWGKSAVYFVATALLRDRGAGPTVIVSPLLALMRNQIAAAQTAGISARTINSANIEEWDEVHAEIEAGTVDVLLVSPERLNNPGFRDLILPRLAESAWHAGHRRGALHLRLGARLPARLPPPALGGRRPHAGRAGARDHRDRQRQGHPRRRGATRLRLARAGRATACAGAARRAGPRQPAPGRGAAAGRAAAAGLAGRPARRTARLGHRLHPDRRRRP